MYRIFSAAFLLLLLTSCSTSGGGPDALSSYSSDRGSTEPIVHDLSGPAVHGLADRAEAELVQECIDSERMRRELGHPVPSPLTGGYVILFEQRDGVALSPAGVVVVEDVFCEFILVEGAIMYIVGHTDTVGDAAANQALSEMWASLVRDELTARGVKPDLINTEGRGEADLAVPTDDGVGNLANRRVVITILQL